LKPIGLGAIIVLQRHIIHEFGEITKNKGHYAVQGHSRSPIFVAIESTRLPISD